MPSMFHIPPCWQRPHPRPSDFAATSMVMNAIRSGCDFDTSTLSVSTAGSLITIEGTAGDDMCVATIRRIASEVIGYDRLRMRVFLA